jgi:hypothetical protein
MVSYRISNEAKEDLINYSSSAVAHLPCATLNPRSAIRQKIIVAHEARHVPGYAFSNATGTLSSSFLVILKT